jgi:alpha-beta hydrolase superfamily lysophospholipase
VRVKKLKFPGSLGHQLGAQLDLPEEGEPRAYALFAHCFTCTKDLKAVYHIDQALTGEGIAVFRFDFTGLGESEGDFSDTTFTSNVGDLVAASRYMEEAIEAPKVLIGHSLGGAAVLKAAMEIPSCRAVATIAAPSEPGHVSSTLAGARAEAAMTGETTLRLGGRTLRIRREFFDDLEESRMEQTLRALDRALLVFHSPLDEVVGIDNAAKIFATARHPKSFISLDRADHLLTNEADARYVGAMVATWAGKYIA